jgi:hypothetical protein
MAMSRFFGIVDKKTARLGPAYAREIRQVRTATWAAVAKAEHEAWRNNLRRHYLASRPRPKKFSPPSEGWLSISELRQRSYLAGVRHPHDRTIEDVAKHAPGSRIAFYSVLWEALSPGADLSACRNIVMAFGEQDLESVVRSLASGQAHDVAGLLAELRTTGALVAFIRLASHERDGDRAFDAGCAVVQALCFHSVSPYFSTIASRLWNLASEGILEGLQKDGFRFSRCRDGFLEFSNVLWERLGSAEALYGIHRLASGPRFTWATIVDMNRECIRGFATPGLECPDALESFLDYGSSNKQSTSILDRNPLFIPAGSRRPEEKCNSETLHGIR